MTYVLAIDQGTTSSRAALFDRKLAVVASAQKEFPQHFPRSGWVEHDPEDLWSSTLKVCRAAIRKAGVSASEIAAIDGTTLSNALDNAKAAGIKYPISGMWGGATDDVEGFRRFATELRDLGYYGMMLGMREHVALAHEIFTPTAAEIAYWSDLDRLATEAAADPAQNPYLPVVESGPIPFLPYFEYSLWARWSKAASALGPPMFVTKTMARSRWGSIQT